MSARVGWCALCLTALLLGACERAAPPAVADVELGIRNLRAGDDAGADAGFARAVAPRELVFPADHGSHPEYRTEWWYFTGNLAEPSGRHYGFELTFFRIALAPKPVVRESAWGTNEVWMAHFAVTDTQAGRFIAHERFARGALGLAGATTTPLRVWTEQWFVEGDPAGAGERFTLHARDADAALDLELVALKPAVPQGDRGLDAKGPEPGNASYYYSVPRLRAQGALEVGGRRVAVEGHAWMDREWSTSALSPGVVGWDWFALQLSDGRDLMFYRLRRADGTASPFSSGSLIEPDGTRRALGAADVQIEALRYWRSPRSRVRYPVAWRLTVPSEELELTIEPRLDDQELALTVRYWEGAVEVRGRGGAITGEGYLELAGY